jgi:hypothetical protein
MSRTGAALLLWALVSAPVFASARLTEKPGSGQSLRAGATTMLRFAVDEEIEEMEVLLSLDGGHTFSLRVTREMSKGTHELRWRVPNLPTTRARLALRVGNGEDEFIRDVSEEFTILAGGTEPFENILLFRGEWRAGEALEEVPSHAPLDAPDLGGGTESIRALGHDRVFNRTIGAAPTGSPPDRDPEAVEPIHPDPISKPTSLRVPLNLPKRE